MDRFRNTGAENPAKIAIRRLLALPTSDYVRETVKDAHGLILPDECTNLDVIAIVQEHLQRKGGSANE